jgi:hypothetical protein
MRFRRLIPRRLRLKLFKWENKGVTERQDLFWTDDKLVEFWLDGFNENMTLAFAHLVELYNQLLKDDPNWHYFYEDHYSLVRCSLKYRDKVKKFFDDRNIKYKWPATGWSETLYTTSIYKKRFKALFHNFSVLTIEMFNNSDGKYLHEAADRICHCYLNHALYLAHVSGYTDYYTQSGYPIDFWEADKMADLTARRAYHIGRCSQNKSIAKQFEESLGMTGDPNEILIEAIKLIKTAEAVLVEKNKEYEDSEEEV